MTMEGGDYGFTAVDTANTYAGILMDVLAAQGVRHVVCSPGSRNAPLLIAASQRQFERSVVHDERVAGFIALGIALASRSPVALICTSGTAVLNYAPAVAEAYYQEVPLIVISADRPAQWIDQDDSQTIRQSGVLDAFVRRSYSFPAVAPGDAEMEWYINRIANDAVLTATAPTPGPVHINMALGGRLGELKAMDNRLQRVVNISRPVYELDRKETDRLAEELCNARILLSIGFHAPDDRLSKAVRMMASLPNVAVAAESIANIHGLADCSDIDVAMAHLSSDGLDTLRPDIVISLGGALVSRRLKEFLRSTPGLRHYSLGLSDTTVDCFCHLSRRIECDPAWFLRRIASIMDRRGITANVAGYAGTWRNIRAGAAMRLDRYIRTCGWCELAFFEALSRHFPKGANLFLSNGTPVRYGQLFRFNAHACYANRGVSGIDGCSSTALGTALAYNGMTVLVTGDMSFAYDFGAMISGSVPHRMRIIVINNGGGSIFRFIATTSGLPMREELFCAPPKLRLDGLAQALGLRYMLLDGLDDADSVLRGFFSPAYGAALLEVRVDPDTSAMRLKELLSPHATTVRGNAPQPQPKVAKQM